MKAKVYWANEKHRLDEISLSGVFCVDTYIKLIYYIVYQIDI